MELSRKETDAAPAQLGLWDAISIIVGIVIGAGIYESPPIIFNNVSGPGMGLGIWVVAGLLALAGAFCYGELATTYPRSGGDYNYLTRAFGAPVGFLFGWAQLAVILTGSIGAMGYVFARYAVRLWDLDQSYGIWFAVLAVSALSGLNMMGVVLGKGTQNILTAAKVLGLGGIIAAGFLYGNASALTAPAEAGDSSSWFGLAMILVLYTYGGWNDAAFVAAEVRNRRRNMPLALVLGVAAIMVIYLLINASYLMALGFAGAKKSDAIAADTLNLALGDVGSKAMALLVMISALGAVNGLIFTGARVYSTLGTDYKALAWLGHWNPRLGSPFASLLTQAVISLAWIVAVGSAPGRTAIDQALHRVGLEPVPWDRYFGGFSTLLASTAPVFWFFFLLTGISLFVLRYRDAGIERPFSVPLFPLVPLLFCGSCVYMLYSAVDYAGKLTWIGAVLVLIGLPLYLLSPRNPGLREATSENIPT